jgi:hypothetical protein
MDVQRCHNIININCKYHDDNVEQINSKPNNYCLCLYYLPLYHQ